MSDVLHEFKEGGRLSNYNPDGVCWYFFLYTNDMVSSRANFQEIDFAGFKIFMDIFLEVATPEDLCKHLFLSFVRVPQPANIDGKTLKVQD